MPHQSGILISSVILTILNAYNIKEPDLCWGTFISNQALQACYDNWNGNLWPREELKHDWLLYIVLLKAKLWFSSTLLIYNQDGMDVSFNILTVINSIKTVFIHGQSVKNSSEPTTILAQQFDHFGPSQEQITHLLLLIWYLHRLVVIPSWVKQVFIRFRLLAVDGTSRLKRQWLRLVLVWALLWCTIAYTCKFSLQLANTAP